MFDPRLLCIIVAEGQTEYVCSCVRSTMLLFILGACSLPDIEFVVSTKAASGYTRAIPCPTDGDP